MEVSARLPGNLQTLQKHPRLGSGSKRPRIVHRPRIEECLPRDALEAVMGFLDLETLCTARLVSKTFCAAASAQVCSLALPSPSKAVSLHRYARLRHVTVRHSYMRLKEDESLAQIDPGLRELATTLAVKIYRGSIAETRDCLSQAALMPKLRKLEVKGPVEHEAALLACCTNLEAITFQECSISVARAILTMRHLTSICIGCEVDSADVSWLGHATNLTNLQALCIPISGEAMPLIGNLTGLTGLTLLQTYSREEEEEPHSIAPLARLTRLRSLKNAKSLLETDVAIACSLGSGSLVNLQLADAYCARLLTHQTALTRLNLDVKRLCDLQHIGALRIQVLQSLKFTCHDREGSMLDAEGLSALTRLTSMTKLSMTVYGQPRMALIQRVAHLTHFRSLSLSWVRLYGSPRPQDPSLPLSPLTALTKLNVFGVPLDNTSMRALLVLTGLQVLALHGCCLTDDVLPDLGVLTNLSALTLDTCGVTSLAPVSKLLDPLRGARGLLPLRTSMRWKG